MSSTSKSSEGASKKSSQWSQFDRGTMQLLDYFATLTKSEIMSLQLLFFALLEILSSKLTENSADKSSNVFNLLLDVFHNSRMLPASMVLSAKSIRSLALYKNYVRILQEGIQRMGNSFQNACQSPSKLKATLNPALKTDFTNAFLSTKRSANLNLDMPQLDFQLKIPMEFSRNDILKPHDLNNLVVFRYVRDFYEIRKIGKGAFGSVFCAKNRLDGRSYAIKKAVFHEGTNRTVQQAKCALREVRILASLSHPNIVQYNCAWLELVPVENEPSQGFQRAKEWKSIPSKAQSHDSIDDIIEFKSQSTSLPLQNKIQNDNSKLTETSSVASKSPHPHDSNESENSDFELSDQHSEIDNNHSCHSDRSSSPLSTEISRHNSKASDKTSSNENLSNKQLVPLHSRIQTIHPTNRSIFINSKIVLFIQMELCNKTLCEWLHDRNQIIIDEKSDEDKNVTYALNELSQSQCWHIFKQLLSGVQYLHSNSFVHRDIKPRNIFLSYDSNDPQTIHVKLGDFGLATVINSKSTSAPQDPIFLQTSTGVGTALYSPPEQLNSRHCIATEKSDSYSLGIVLYELFSIFSTEMERCERLNNLRVNMKVDEQFMRNYLFEAALIQRLVSISPDNRPSVDEVLKVYKLRMQHRNKKST